MKSHPEGDSLELRIARLEAAALNSAGSPFAPSLDQTSGIAALILLAAAAYSAQLGLGLPNHPYQWAAGALLVFFGYQRHWFRHPKAIWLWVLAAFNLFAAASVAKLFIGSGRHFPFQWFKFPELSWARNGMIPEPSLTWQQFSFGHQEVDLTAVQTFMIGLLIVGRCLRLQGFTSLIALLLLAASLPALTSFHWDWVFPSLALIGLGFYVQSRTFRAAH